MSLYSYAVNLDEPCVEKRSAVEEYTAICILAGLAERVSGNLSPLMDTVNFETIDLGHQKRIEKKQDQQERKQCSSINCRPCLRVGIFSVAHSRLHELVLITIHTTTGRPSTLMKTLRCQTRRVQKWISTCTNNYTRSSHLFFYLPQLRNRHNHFPRSIWAI